MLIKKKLTLCAAVVAIGAAPIAWAQDSTHPMPKGEEMPGTTHKDASAKELPPPNEPVEEAQAYPSHAFQGWVDQEIVGSLDAEDAVYAMFEVGLRVNHAINEQFGGKLQLNGRWAQLDVVDPTGASVGTVAASNGSLSLLAREAYAYGQSSGGKVKFQVGKWFIPIGFELADPPDLYQYSNSNVFVHFLPTEAVGVLSALTFSDSVNLQLWVTPGPTDFDFFSTFGTPTIGERLGFTFGDLGLGVSALIGPDGEDTGFDKFLLDIDGAYQASEKMLLGFEVAYRTPIDNGSVGENEIGVMAMTNYLITEKIGATARVDFINHDGGEPEIGLTGAGLFNFATGWDFLVEVREDINADGTKNSDLTGALELIYQFVK